MTTTPEPTPERIVQAMQDELEYRVRTAIARRAATLRAGDFDNSRSPVNEEVDAGKARIAELAAGLLGGDPTKEQVERAALEMHRCKWPGGYGWREYLPLARAALTAAAGVAPQAHANAVDMSSERVNSGPDSSHVAPQEPCPQPCEHLSAEDAREGRDCREHPCTCPTSPLFDREKLIEEARAVAGPKSLYAHTSVAHLLIRLADALAAQPVLDGGRDE